MIRIGIVGCNYGRLVHLPAFRLDPRCEVVALAGTRRRAYRRAGACREYPAGIRQLERSRRASGCRRRHHCDTAEPAAGDRHARARTGQAGVRRKADGRRSARAPQRMAEGRRGQRPGHHGRFQFFRDPGMAQGEVAAGARRDRPLAPCRGQLERRELRPPGCGSRTGRRIGDDGGGVLGNFVSHSFHYLEWLCGPISGLSARLSGLPDEPAMETNAAHQHGVSLGRRRPASP